VPVGHANDGGGSIRIPASCCGLVGLKPTRARTPIGPDAAEGLNGMGVEFAVTRSVRDCAALLDSVQGPGLGDPYVAPPPTSTYVEAMNRRSQPLRIALMTTAWDRQQTDPAVVNAVMAAAKQCEALGHTIVEAAPSVDWDEFIMNCMVYWTANLATWVGELAKVLKRPVDSTTIESTTLACYRYGLTLKATDLLHAMEFCNRLTRSFAAFFQQYDLMLTPTLPAPPSPLGTINSNDATLDAEGWTRKVFAFTPFTPLFNMTGQPAISLPLARMGAGLPIGIHFVARYGAEDTLINLAAQLERAMPWPQVSPLAVAAAG
jgi:amidase